MIYRFLELSPFLLVLLYCPLISLIAGVIVAALRWSKIMAPAAAFLLPLLYITVDWNTFTTNLDAWLLWGSMYALLAYFAMWLMTSVRKQRT